MTARTYLTRLAIAVAVVLVLLAVQLYADPVAGTRAMLALAGAGLATGLDYLIGEVRSR